MQKFQKAYSTLSTPQSQPIPGSNQVQNNAGGYAWAATDWTRLDRFLVLGTEGGTLYIKEHKLTAENAEAVARCIKADGQRVVARIVEISHAGRAPKNDPALFALAMCFGMGDEATRKAAAAALPKVARIATHLFHFLEYAQAFRGWGRALRSAVADWYTEKRPDDLAMQLIKYRQRDGWTHADTIRLSHPKPADTVRNSLFVYAVKGTLDSLEGLELITAFERLQAAGDEKAALAILKEYPLPWECVPTQFLKAPEIWRQLLPSALPMTAMIRNLGRMTACGAIKPMSDETKIITDRLRTQEALTRARVHPVQILAALLAYKQGHGEKGNLTWHPVSQIVDALDAAFYLSFGAVRPSGKRIMLGLDVSGSMTWGEIAGVPGLSPRVGSAAMALVTAATEERHHIMGFCDVFVPIPISPRQRLDDVCKTVDRLQFGRTDCALPMLYAMKEGIEVDEFVILTDNETWFGKIHPAQALVQYRKQTGINAKLVTVGMTSGGFSIADPNDEGSLDVIGFNTSTPQLISDFA